MSTSGSTSFEQTRNQIIATALRKLGVLGKGQVITASEFSEDVTNAQVALNGLTARLNTLGMPLWKRVESTVTLAANTSAYSLPSALKLVGVYLNQAGSTTQYALQQRSLYDLRNMPITTTGAPVAYSFQPTLLEGGTLSIWPTPSAADAALYSLLVIYQKEFDTFTSANETPDFPAYWTDALTYGLAHMLAPEYGIPLPDRKAIEKDAMLFLAQAQSYGDEDGSITFSPDRGV